MKDHPDQTARVRQLENQKGCCGGKKKSFGCDTEEKCDIPVALDWPLKKQLPVKIKKLSPSGITPTRANSGDAGWDLYAAENTWLIPGEQKLIKTDISFEIPQGYVGLIWPRSGLAVKNGVDVFAGVIDSGYRGEVKICLFNARPCVEPLGKNTLQINKGDRIAQILFQEVPEVSMVEVDDLDDGSRGCSGFGSSGE